MEYSKCPICGGRFIRMKEDLFVDDLTPYLIVYCSDCGREVWSKGTKFSDAKKAWNKYAEIDRKRIAGINRLKEKNATKRTDGKM